jgi:hypothetical protein
MCIYLFTDAHFFLRSPQIECTKSLLTSQLFRFQSNSTLNLVLCLPEPIQPGFYFQKSVFDHLMSDLLWTFQALLRCDVMWSYKDVSVSKKKTRCLHLQDKLLRRQSRLQRWHVLVYIASHARKGNTLSFCFFDHIRDISGKSSPKTSNEGPGGE